MRVGRHVHHVVHHADGDSHVILELGSIELRERTERANDILRQVHGAKQAGTVSRQRHLTAGIGGGKLLTIHEVVPLVDAVDKHDTRLSVSIGRAHDRVPQVSRQHRVIVLAVEHEVERGIISHRVHQLISDSH